MTLSRSEKPYQIEAAPTSATAADFVLDSHLMHIHERLCTGCGHIFKWSDLFEVHIHSTRIGLSGLRRLVPAQSLRKGYPIAVLELKRDTTPTCVYCVDTSAASGDIPSVDRLAAEDAWARTLRRKYERTTPAPTAPPPPTRTIPPLDQL